MEGIVGDIRIRYGNAVQGAWRSGFRQRKSLKHQTRMNRKLGNTMKYPCRQVGVEERLDDYDGAVLEEAEQGGRPNRQVPDVREPEGRPRRNRKQVEKYQAGFS